MQSRVTAAFRRRTSITPAGPARGVWPIRQIACRTGSGAANGSACLCSERVEQLQELIECHRVIAVEVRDFARPPTDIVPAILATHEGVEPLELALVGQRWQFGQHSGKA